MGRETFHSSKLLWRCRCRDFRCFMFQGKLMRSVACQENTITAEFPEMWTFRRSVRVIRRRRSPHWWFLGCKHMVAFLRRTQKPSTCVFHSTTRSLPRIRNIPNRYTQQELGVACDQTGQLMLNISWCAPRHDWKCRKLMFWGSNMEIHQAHIRIFSVHYSPPLDAGADCGVGGSGLCWNLQFPLHTFGQRNHVQCGLCFRKLCDQGAG